MNFGTNPGNNDYNAGANRPPPEEQPPSYAASRYVPQRFVRSSLRPAVLLCCFFSAIWSMAAGAQYIRNRNDHNNDSKLNKMYIALAIVYFAVAAVEVYGFGAAWTQRLGLVRMYFYGSAVAGLAAIAAEIMRIVTHFHLKSNVIAACVGDQLDANTPGDTVTSAQAQTLCQNAWSNSTWWDIGLLLLTLVLAFFFTSLAASYLHQLSNPASMRTQTAHLAPSAAYNYPLAPYPPQPYGQGFVPPPYQPGGLPQYDGYAEGFGPGAKEKEEANPFADATTPHSATFSGLRREEAESTDQVTFEPRRENEGRV